MIIEYPCGICKNGVNQNDKSVQCVLCNKWNYIECVGLSSAYSEKIKNVIKPWYCSSCSKELDFSYDLVNIIHVQSTLLMHFTNVTNKKSKELLHNN